MTVARSAFADVGRVECSSFRLTDRGRRHVPSDFLPCYTGGIDAHGARGWIVRLNRFEDIRCGKGFAEHAVRLDFHLSPAAAGAIDRGAKVRGAGLDIDGKPHAVGPPDLGADEFRS